MTAEQVVRQHYQYFNDRRFDKAVDLIDPQAVFHTLPTRQRLMGVAGYRDGVCLAARFCRRRLEIQTLTAVDSVVDIDFLGRGTHTGELVLGDALSVPATGLLIELPVHDRLEIRDGRIVKAELDFDEQALRRRLFAGR